MTAAGAGVDTDALEKCDGVSAIEPDAADADCADAVVDGDDDDDAVDDDEDDEDDMVFSLDAVRVKKDSRCYMSEETAR